MQCRNCGAEIADKALICYRCGTATTEAKFKPAAMSSNRSRSTLLVTVIVLAVAVVLALVVSRSAGGEAPRAIGAIVVVVAAVIVGLRAYARRR